MAGMARSGIREPMQRVEVDVTFLRMDAPPPGTPPDLPHGASVQLASECSVGFYRYLYHTVGHDYLWWLRRTVPDGELALLLARPEITIHVLYQAGEPMGFYELERRGRDAGTNLAYFGLMPQAIGRGAGRALLRHAVDTAWAGKPRVLTVNTCTADHPRALPNYLEAGFRIMRTVREAWPVPARLGLPIAERFRVG